MAAPVAPLDPSAVDALYQVQEFGLAVMGIGLVSTFAAGTARIMSRAAGAYTATAAATVLEQAAAPAAPVAVAPSCDLPARAAEQPAVPAQASLGLGDLSELREAAAAAVAAVASTAAVSTTAAVSSEPAPAKAAAPAANGAAVKPGMTVEEATQVGGRGGQAGCTGRPHRDRPGHSQKMASHRMPHLHLADRSPDSRACLLARSKSRTGLPRGAARARARARPRRCRPVATHPPPASPSPPCPPLRLPCSAP